MWTIGTRSIINCTIIFHYYALFLTFISKYFMNLTATSLWIIRFKHDFSTTFHSPRKWDNRMCGWSEVGCRKRKSCGNQKRCSPMMTCWRVIEKCCSSSCSSCCRRNGCSTSWSPTDHSGWHAWMMWPAKQSHVLQNAFWNISLRRKPDKN